jgi:hypothetical protein
VSEKQSISDTLEKYTMEIMKKLEGQIPLHIKSFSDFSREYIKLLENSFEINCSIEKKIFGNMNLDEKSIKLLDDYFEVGTKFYNTQIDMTTEFFKNYLNIRLSLMEAYNKFVKEFANEIKTNKSDIE